ncbi:MAG: M28 family peptidase [Sphingobacteriales bacterium]|nr:M28 family peptidase [Sphingobacteriales bacterium]
MNYFSKSLSVISLLILGFGSSHAQNLPKAETDVLKSLEHNISYLADDHLEGRLMGSRGEKIAYEFIVENFQSLNILPKGDDGYLQRFYLQKIVCKKGELIIENKQGKLNFLQINPSRNFPLSMSKPGKEEGKCIWVGYGIEAPDLGVNDYANIKSVKGKIVVMRLGHPDFNNPHAKLATVSDLETKITNAIQKGASGIIIINTHDEIIEPDFKPIVKAPFKSVPIYFLGKAASVDSSQFVNAKISLNIDTAGIKLEGHNVIGYINHKAPQTVVIGAHYDHLGYNELGGSTYRKQQNEKPQIHNGADDNASGTAALIELAELLQKSPYRSHNYLFIAFSGEEQGLLGSHYFVDHPTIPLSQINYMINMDMVGRLDTIKKSFSISGSGTSPRWDSILPNINTNDIKVKYDPSGTGASDHTSFYNVGIPVLHFFTGNHADYHKPSDDWELIHLPGTLQIIKYIYTLVGKLDKQSKLAFTKTKESMASTTTFKVTLGIMPDYLFEGKGVKVDGTTEGKPAAIAGIKRGDVIIKLHQFTIQSMDDYMETLGKLEKGLQTKVLIIRAGKELELDITL